MSHNGKELKKSIREAKEIPKRIDPFKYDTIVDPRGQWDHPGQITKIPSNNITMKGVPYPVLGIDNEDNQQMMYPGMDYTFPGQSVTEYPMAQNGKQVVAKPRTLLNVASQFVPGYEAYLDWKSMLHGMSTGDKNEMYTGILGMAAPISGKALGDVVDYATEKTLGKNTADYNQQKRESIVNMSQHDREQLFLKYGHGGYDAWAKAGFPKLKNGGWLDKYQDKGEVKGSWLPPQLRQDPDPGPPKLVDKRKLPQSGVVVDKRTNQAYYAGDKGETGTFPVLTGQNPNVNVNPHNLDYLSKHPEARGTPLGYYMMNKASAAMPKFVSEEYEGKVRNIDGIPAFGYPAPSAADLAAHWTFGKHEDPKEYKRREKLYNCPPGKRWTSYGCVNMQASSFDEMNAAIPNPDTLMVIDSKYAADQALLKQMQGRMKELGGSTDFEEEDDYRSGGSTNPLMLSRSKRNKTSKNIQSSINKIFLRNYTIFGPGGKNIYDHNSKFEEGGSNWLEKYK